MGKAEAPTYQATVTEQFADLIRTGIGRHIKILRFATEQQVAHTTTDQIGAITAVLQPVQHL